jgi:hypothetical protein
MKINHRKGEEMTYDIFFAVITTNIISIMNDEYIIELENN